MRFVLRILGTEVIALELGEAESDDESTPSGPERRFGFHGGSGGHVERSDTWEEGAAEVAHRAPSPERDR